MTKRAVGYTRVSTLNQQDNTSLGDQAKAIQYYCQENDLDLIRIYSEGAKSGASMEKRPALLELLRDAADKKFNVMVCSTMDRFGRNLRDILNNRHILSQCDVEEVFLKEQNESSLSMNIRGVIADEERGRIKIRTHTGKISKLLKGYPYNAKKGTPITGNRFIFGRFYNLDTQRLEVDPNKKNAMEWAANEIIYHDKSLWRVRDGLDSNFGLNMSIAKLSITIGKLGDTWSIKIKGLQDVPNVESYIGNGLIKDIKIFDDHGVIFYKVPPLLDNQTLERIKMVLSRHRISDSPDKQVYLLSGFLRCAKCNRLLTGHSLKNRRYVYYRHPKSPELDCYPFTNVNGREIERAVMKFIFQVFYDKPSFDEAIRDSLPDEEMINGLKESIRLNEQELKRVEGQLDKLLDDSLNGAFSQSTIQKKAITLESRKVFLKEELARDKQKLETLPDLEEIKERADFIRLQLADYYSDEYRIDEMTFEEKRRLLFYLFDGKDEKNHPHGIYITKDKNSVKYELRGAFLDNIECWEKYYTPKEHKRHKPKLLKRKPKYKSSSSRFNISYVK